MGQTHDDWHEWRHGVDARLDKLEARLDKVEERLDAVEGRLKMVEEGLADVSKRLVMVERDLRWGGGLILLLLAAQIGANVVR